MCSTKSVAESTNCGCALNPRQALEEIRREQPITSAIVLGLGRGLVWAVGATLTVTVSVLGGVVMLIAWGCHALWQVMTMPAETVPDSVKPVTPVAKPQVNQAYGWDFSTLKVNKERVSK